MGGCKRIAARQALRGLVAGALLFAGCGSEDPLGIAVVAPQSGPNALIGQEVRNVVEMVLDERGGTVAGRTVAPIYVDSQSDGELAAEAYRGAITSSGNNVVAGFFDWHSDVSLALMDVAADEELAHIAALGATGGINEKYRSDPERYAVWSKGWPTPSKLGVNYIVAIEDAIAAGSLQVAPSERRAALYGEDSSWGRSFAQGIREQLEARGWTVVAEEYVDPEGVDFTAAVESIRASSPRIVIGSVATRSIYTFISQTRRAFADTEQPLLVADGLGWNADWYQTLGDDSNGVVDQIPQFATQEAQDFATRYRDRYGEFPSPSQGGLAYDYVRFTLKVLEETDRIHGSITRDTVREVHATQVLGGEIDMTGGILMDRYIWNATTAPDPVVGGEAFTFPVLQYSGGQGRVVWPESLTSGDARLE